MFNVECGPELVALIQHSTFHIQHSTFAFLAWLACQTRSRGSRRNKPPALKRRHPRSPTSARGCRRARVPPFQSRLNLLTATADGALGNQRCGPCPPGRQKAAPPSPVCRPGEPTREDAAVSRPECTQRVDGEIAFGMNALREPAGLRARRRARIRRDRDQDQRGRGDHMLHARERDQRDGQH